MKKINFLKYFLQSFLLFILFFLFKILGLRISSFISGKIFSAIGPIFRSKKRISNNLRVAFPNFSNDDIEYHSNEMWNYYGKIAKPEVIHITRDLPKTRSGKIMRRILRKIANKDTANLGDVTTLADPSIVEELINSRQ